MSLSRLVINELSTEKQINIVIISRRYNFPLFSGSSPSHTLHTVKEHYSPQLTGDRWLINYNDDTGSTPGQPHSVDDYMLRGKSS